MWNITQDPLSFTYHFPSPSCFAFVILVLGKKKKSQEKSIEMAFHGKEISSQFTSIFSLLFSQRKLNASH